MQHEQFKNEYIKRKNDDGKSYPDKYPVVVMGSPFDIVLSNVDIHLKYTSIFNPYHDFDQDDYLGKRDDQIDSSYSSKILQELKRRVLTTGNAEQSIIDFATPAGTRTCSISVSPLYDKKGDIIGATCASADITSHTNEIDQQKITIASLKQALSEAKTLKGVLPVCSYCKSIKDKEGKWHNFDTYITQHTDAQISHGMCPRCLREHYPDYYNR